MRLPSTGRRFRLSGRQRGIGAAGISRGPRLTFSTVVEDRTMSAEDLENYETDMELQLYREYRDVVGLFKYVIETERRFYLTNEYVLDVRNAGGEVFFEVSMSDAWVWVMYRPARFVKAVKVDTCPTPTRQTC